MSWEEKVKAWVKEQGGEEAIKAKQNALNTTMDLPGVEIFMAGKWNGDEYEIQDLDDMVDAFNEIGGQIKPYLKLGHDETQTLLRQDELPAAGWIKNVRRVGKRLLADFTRVPKKIYDLIRAGAYSRVSSEIWWNIEIGKKKYRRVLKAVAVLGAETPAVHDLNDIISLYALDAEEARSYETATTPRTYEVRQGDLRKQKETDMDDLEKCNVSLSEANKKLAEASTEMDGMKKKMSEQEAEIKRLSDENTAHKAEIEKVQTEKRHAEISATIDKWVNDKKVLPAQKEALMTLMTSLPAGVEKKYKMGDKEMDLDGVLKHFIEANSVNMSTEQTTQSGSKLELADAAKKLAAEKKIPYKEALLQLSREQK